MAIQVTFDDNEVWTWQKFGEKIAERFGWELVKTSSAYTPTGDDDVEWWDWYFKTESGEDRYMTADGCAYRNADCDESAFLDSYDLREELDIDYLVGKLTFTDGTPDEACLVVRE